QAEVRGSYLAGPGTTSATEPLTLVQQPQSRTIQELQSVTFSVGAQGIRPYTFQWFSNNVPVVGATSSSLTLTGVRPSANGAQFFCRVANSVPQTVDSSVAVLTVNADLTRPTLVGAAGGTAWGLNNDTTFGVRFSEPVNQADAQNPANYSLPGFTILGGALQADNVTVVLAVTTSLKAVGCKTITVNNVRDRAPSQNVIAANSQTPLIYAEGTSRHSRFNNSGAGFPNSPDVISHPPLIENPEGGGNHGDNYVGQTLALLSPPVTGNYKFYIASDDSSALFLSTDENPSHKVQIAREPNWSTFRTYNGAGGGGGGRVCPGTDCNISVPVNLVAGCRYYLEVIHNEGGGGDYFSVAWQTPAGGPVPGVPADGSLPIGAQYISPFETPPVIAATDPINQTISEGARAILTAGITGSPILTYQWFSNGVAVVDGTNSSYTTLSLRFPGNNNDHYYVVVTNSLGKATSRTNTLTVIDDNTPPTVARVLCGPALDRFTIVFSEIMDQPSVEDTFNYTIDNSASPTTVTLNPDGRSVTLLFGPQAPNSVHTIALTSDITDFAQNPLGATNIVARSCVSACAGVKFEAYDTASTPGNAVTLLTSHPNFPNNPRDVATIQGLDTRLAYPDDSHEQYGGRMRGFFFPPVSGNWIFYTKSDDASDLYLNPTGPSSGGRIKIAAEPGCCSGFAAHPSIAYPLTAGEGYYIEGLWKEGGGGDFMQVAAKLQSDATDPNTLSPLGAQFLGQSAPADFLGTVTFPTQPLTQTVFENSILTLSVRASVPVDFAALKYQWQRDSGSGFTDIPGATGTNYVISQVVLGDNGAKFRAVVCTIGANTASAVATLTVQPDHTPPGVVSCRGSSTMDKFTIVFNEPVDSFTAQDSFNFDISGPGGPLNITSLVLSADGRSLSIFTARQAENTDYVVTINNVMDRASTANTIAVNTHVTCHSFLFSCGFVFFETYNTPVGGVAVSLLTSSPNYPDNPRERFYIPTFDTRNVYPDDSHEQYGGRISGQFVPKVSGNYIFYIRSDDASELYLNPTGPEAGGAIKIQEETGCCNGFSVHASAPQALTAGQRYFIMALYKEGGGGDFAQVAAKLATDATNPDLLTPIGSGNLGVYADPAGVSITINKQACAQTICINPLGGGPGNTGVPLVQQDFNATGGGFTVSTPVAFNGPWAYNLARGSWQEHGQDPDNAHANTSLLNSPVSTVTTPGIVRVQFVHRYSFEYDGTAWDGGQVRVSINGGAYSTVPAAAFTQNGYNGSVASVSTSELRGQSSFISESANYGAGYITTVAELGCFNPGDTLSVQFMAASDSNTRGQDPNWEIDSFAITQGNASANALFNVGASAVVPGNPSQPIFIQWQRNSGAGFVDVAGATGNSYAFTPTVADNGACFRAALYVPGAVSFSSTACLTVNQANTPPEFTCGGNVGLPEDCGPQSRVWATGILPDSIHPLTGTFTSDFSSGVPAGTAVYGNAYVSGGILHLTDAFNGQQGAFIVNDLLNGTPLRTFTINFKALLGQGTAPPADGFSVSIGNDIPNGAISEEGFGNGIIVAFDSYDNGGGEAPAIDVKWRGVTIAHTSVPSVETGGQFVPVSIVLHEDGTLDLTAAGNPVYVGLVTGYTPIAGARYAFGGRTGGLNENNWVDDLSISAQAADASVVEAAQQVQFIVSNNNPALFSQQPAISATGVLTYTPSVHAAGVATVTVIAKDNGGTGCSGNDTTAPCTFTISLNCALTARDDGGATRQDQPITVALSKLQRNDGVPQGSLVSPFGPISVVHVSATSTNGGTVTLGASNVVYTPRPGFSGVDRFTYTIGDGQSIGSAQVEILVVNGTLPSQNQVSLIPKAGSVLIRFAGIPGRAYQIQRAITVTGPWSTLATPIAPLHGIIEYEDTAPPQPTAFYRTSVP
ncbi:MAG: hypothetical protein QOF48_2639, partial [Verrucomicrobiota bacterium]